MNLKSESKKPKILVIDDHACNLKYMVFVLEPAGYEIYLELNSSNGLKAAVNFKPDIIFLDIVMPNPDGFEVCRQLKSNATTKGIPVILNSTDDYPETIMTARKAGAEGFVAKPFGHEKVNTIIEYILQAKSNGASTNQLTPTYYAPDHTSNPLKGLSKTQGRKTKEWLELPQMLKFGFMIF